MKNACKNVNQRGLKATVNVAVGQTTRCTERYSYYYYYYYYSIESNIKLHFWSTIAVGFGRPLQF